MVKGTSLSESTDVFVKTPNRRTFFFPEIIANKRGTISGILKIGQPYCIKKLKLKKNFRYKILSSFFSKKPGNLWTVTKKNLVKIQIWNLCFKWAETETYLSLESSMTNVSPSSDSFMLMYSLIGKLSGSCNLKIGKKFYFVIMF